MEITTLDTKLETLSPKYKLVKTNAIREKFEALGFKVDSVINARVRNKSKEGYQKHTVRLSNDRLLHSAHKDMRLQLIITNSHDGLSSFKMQLGIFRLVCSNGLTVGSDFESITLRHTGSIVEQIDSSIERMVAQIDKLDRLVTVMKNAVLNVEKQNEFIAKAIKLRYPNKELNDVTFPILRPEDAANDVFTLMNRVQEALVRGGNQYVTSNNKVRTARPLSSIKNISEINEQLFDLANDFAKAV